MASFRLVASAIGIGSGTALTAGCVGVLGLNEEKRDVVSELCACPEAEAALGSSEACRVLLSSRLEKAPPHERAAWMQVHEANCSAGCSPTCWDSVSTTPPACTRGGNECLPGLACADCCYGESPTPGTCAEKL